MLGPYGSSSTADLGRDHTEWVRVDLRRRARVGEVVLYPGTDDPGAGTAANVDVRVSTDGRSWTSIASTRGDVSMMSAPRALHFAPMSARFVEVRGNGLRANLKDPGGPYRLQLAELAVLGPPPGA